MEVVQNFVCNPEAAIKVIGITGFRQSQEAWRPLFSSLYEKYIMIN